jgi:hypothetical protein
LPARPNGVVAGRRIGDIETLRAETSAWASDVNATQRGVVWQMKLDDAGKTPVLLPQREAVTLH